MVPRTKNSIIEGFNSLISRCDFDKITVEMIAKEAGVSHATFYRYFRDKYDVMNANYKNLLDYYATPERCGNYQELYCNLFRAALDWRDIQNAFESIGINSFSTFIYEYSYNTALEITKQNRNGRGFTEAERLQFDVYCKGISYMYERWIKGQYDLTPEDAAEALYKMMPESLSGYWWK